MPGGRPTKKPRSLLGSRLVQARQEAGLSQQDLADRLGVDQSLIPYWERRSVALRAEQLVALADALGVTTDYLLGRQEAAKRGTGPTGKAKKLFEAVSQLPRRQQEKVFAILEPFVAEHRKEQAS